ncbi:MAG: histidine kinase N-terminal 7TM domain-containing protein [Patescibacteria group bacterium]|nr:histidine kinase N-terminal 7TM domain-containing protein [Patescibacteria group bacterium]
MNSINIGEILVSFLNFFLGLLVWLRNRNSKINLMLALSLMLLALWALGESMFRESVDLSAATFWAIFENLSGSLVPVSFFIFCIYYPYQSFKIKPYLKFLIVASLFIDIIIIITPSLYLDHIILMPPFNNFSSALPGRVYYSVFFCSYLLIAFYILMKKFFKSQGLIKKNSLIILLATGSLAIFGTLPGVILPLIYGVDNPWYVAYLSLPMVIVLTWFILLGDKKLYIK